MQIVNNIVTFTQAERDLFTLIDMPKLDGLPVEQALAHVDRTLATYRVDCAIDYVNLRILEKLRDTLAVATERSSRRLN